MSFILASGSPRRRQLIEQMGIADYTVLSPDVDETVTDGLLPHQVVEQLSLKKAQAVAAQVTADDLILAADTIVVLDGQILGKPMDEGNAVQILTALSGRQHQVYTGFTLLMGDKIVTDHAITGVDFRPLTWAEIVTYVTTGEPMDKAGAYGIQGQGALLVEGIQGDYFNVMGLPLCKVGKLLKGFGVELL